MGEKPTRIEKQLIRVIRASRLTQKELSELSGVDQAALSRFLTENAEVRRTLAMPTVDKLCRVLGLELVQTRKPQLKKRRRR